MFMAMRFEAVCCLVLVGCGHHAGTAGLADTKVPTCGDGVVDFNEECDQGSDTTDGCVDCKVATGFGKLQVIWGLKTFAGTVEPCPGEFPIAELQATSIEDEPGYVTRSFPCADMAAQTLLPAAHYAASIAFVSADRASTYGRTLPVSLFLGTEDGLVSYFITDGGYFSLAWSLSKQSDSSSVSCADVPDTRVEMDVDAAGFHTNNIFSCEQLRGMGPPVPAGPYTVTVRAIDGSNSLLGAAAPQNPRSIAPGNSVTDLGVVDIPIANL